MTNEKAEACGAENDLPKVTKKSGKASLNTQHTVKSWAVHLKDIFSGKTQPHQSKAATQDKVTEGLKPLLSYSTHRQKRTNELSISAGQRNPGTLLQLLFKFTGAGGNVQLGWEALGE